MRTLVATLMFFAVLGCTVGAWADDLGSGRCIDRPMALSISGVSSPEVLVSIPGADAAVLRRPWANGHDQSRAPVTCSDPSQPGCQVDRPNTPPHSLWNAVSGPPGEVTDLNLTVAPADVCLLPCPWSPTESPTQGHGSSPWRPPTA